MARYYNAETLLEFVKQNTPHIDGETTMQCVERAIKNAPTADVVEVKYGEWIRNERNIPKMKEFHKKGIATAMKATSIFYTCSCCNDWGTPIQKYCSGCGAKMNNVVNYESTKTIKIERRSE